MLQSSTKIILGGTSGCTAVFPSTGGELYNHDRKTKMLHSHNKDKSLMTSTSWGKSINIITWNYLIELWCCRNDSEHQSNQDRVKRKKEKIIEKIMWLKSQINTEQIQLHKTLNYKSMIEYPVNNLAMISENLSDIIGSK
jgi:hypothetical protein